MSTATFRFLTFCWAFNCLAICPVFGQVDRNATDRDKSESKVYQRLAEEFPLILKEDKLTFEFPDYETAQQLVQTIFPGNHGGSSSHRGNNQFSIDRRSASTKLVISSLENESNTVFLNEEPVEIKRVALIRDGSNSSSTELFERKNLLQCNHIDPQKREFFVIRQDSDGIRVIFAEGDVLENVEVTSFTELTGHPRFQTIYQAALSFGFRLPISISQEEYLAILAGLLKFTQTNWDEFMQEFADLQSNRFTEREQASKKLIDSLEQWKIAIIWGMTDEKVAKETKARLIGAIKANPDSKAAIQINAVTKNKLTENIPLMILLLSMPPENTHEIRPKLVERLSELTGEQFGDNIEAWKTWSEEKGPASKAKNMAAASSKREENDSGRSERKKNRQIDWVREELAHLLTLGISDDGRFEVDRKSWAKLFGDKSVMELVDHVNEEFKKSGLPNSWLEIGGGYDLSGANHSHLLFARLEEAIEKTEPKDERREHMRMLNRSNARMHLRMNTKDLNRQIQSQKLSVAMRFHGDQQFRPDVVKENFFQFSVVDTSDDSSRISLNQCQNGEFSLLLVGRRLDPVAILGQSKDRKCWVNILSGSEAFSVKADTASELFAKNESELSRLLFPILRENGINLNSTLGGPLEIKNEQGRRQKKKDPEDSP